MFSMCPCMGKCNCIKQDCFECIISGGVTITSIFDRIYFLWVISPNFVKLDSVKEELICLVCGLFGVTLYFYFQNVALLYTVASNVSIINSLSPMFTVILGFIIARSKPSKYFVIGFIISIIGINLVIFSGKIVFDGSLKGNSLAFFSFNCMGKLFGFYKTARKISDGYYY